MSETPTNTSRMMVEANSVDTYSSENNDVSSQLAEIRENYEKISYLQSECSQLMATLTKSDNDSHNSNVQGPSFKAAQERA